MPGEHDPDSRRCADPAGAGNTKAPRCSVRVRTTVRGSSDALYLRRTLIMWRIRSRILIITAYHSGAQAGACQTLQLSGFPCRNIPTQGGGAPAAGGAAGPRRPLPEAAVGRPDAAGRRRARPRQRTQACLTISTTDGSTQSIQSHRLDWLLLSKPRLTSCTWCVACMLYIMCTDAVATALNNQKTHNQRNGYCRMNPHAVPSVMLSSVPRPA